MTTPVTRRSQPGDDVAHDATPRRRRTVLKRGRFGFALPGAAVLAVLSVYPIYLLFKMSVHQVSSGTLNKTWPAVGLDNFSALLKGSDLTGAAGRTIAFVLVVTVIGIVGGLGVAIVVRDSRPASSFLLGMMVFIWALPPVVNGSVWKFLLADKGLLNTIIRALGFEDGVPFLFDSTLSLYSVALVNSWAVIPFNALVFRAALIAIDDSVLEAASIDGVNKWQEIRYILMPSARPTAMILSVLTVVYAFRSFDFIYTMTSGGPGNATTTLPYLSYSQAFVQHDYGLGSATAVFSLVVVGILTVVYVRSTKKDA